MHSLKSCYDLYHANVVRKLAWIYNSPPDSLALKLDALLSSSSSSSPLPSFMKLSRLFWMLSLSYLHRGCTHIISCNTPITYHVLTSPFRKHVHESKYLHDIIISRCILELARGSFNHHTIVTEFPTDEHA